MSALDPLSAEDWQQGDIVAVHEVSHALATARLGIRPDLLHLETFHDGRERKWGGHVESDDPVEVAGAWDRQACLDTVMIALAGLAGEQVMGFPARDLEPEDRAVANRWVERAVPLGERDEALTREFARATELLSRERPFIREVTDAVIALARAQIHHPSYGQIEIVGDELAALLKIQP